MLFGRHFFLAFGRHFFSRSEPKAFKRPDREIKRRTKAVASFPDGRAATMLAAARRESTADGNWGSRRCLDVSLLDGWDERRDMGV